MPLSPADNRAASRDDNPPRFPRLTPNRGRARWPRRPDRREDVGDPRSDRGSKRDNPTGLPNTARQASIRGQRFRPAPMHSVFPSPAMSHVRPRPGQKVSASVKARGAGMDRNRGDAPLSPRARRPRPRRSCPRCSSRRCPSRARRRRRPFPWWHTCPRTLRGVSAERGGTRVGSECAPLTLTS